MRRSHFAIVVLVILSTRAAATEAATPHLQLFPEKTRGASLLAEPESVPAALQIAMVSAIETAMAAEAERLAHDLTAAQDGGGDDQGSSSATIAFVVGALAGFGLAHFLIVHQPSRGILWLAVDAALIVGMILFFDFVFPVGVIFLISFLVERVLQGLDALSATGRGDFRFGAADRLPESGRVAERPRPFAPNVMSLTF